MKAYSLDFRQKIMDVHHAGGTSQRQLAKRFNVALSFIEKLIKQEKEVWFKKGRFKVTLAAQNRPSSAMVYPVCCVSF